MVSEKVAANEHIRETQVRLGVGVAQPLPFLCECDDSLCRQLVRMPAEEYAEARAAPSRRIVAEGHPFEGRIIVSGLGYVIKEA